MCVFEGVYVCACVRLCVCVCVCDGEVCRGIHSKLDWCFLHLDRLKKICLLDISLLRSEKYNYAPLRL